MKKPKPTVVNYKYHPPIYFPDYIFSVKKGSAQFTTLSIPQQNAIRKIENYFRNRWKQARKIKTPLHFTWKKETIASRMDERDYERIKAKHIAKDYNLFLRAFLRNKDLRKKTLSAVYAQFWKDSCRGEFKGDIIDYLDLLVKMYRKVIASKVRNIEKELLTYYLVFVWDNMFSVSYFSRAVLLKYDTFDEFKDEEPIEFGEVNLIMKDLVND